MKGNGAVEGKGWLALYLTPKLIKTIIDVLMLIMVGLVIVVSSMAMNSSSAELETAIADGLVPECVKTYSMSMFCMLGCIMLLILRVGRR